ncbi:MAG: NAD(P)-dependent alcohol dehydrogenase [Rhodothermales bacterium]|nr:NAD(P)-dependent alcohol dehydrogenase [Rhodothermales bacterium]MBO6780858.1 NAD(P)-dependent alcohol dehydrogenase [Rhodothermales bacterium]
MKAIIYRQYGPPEVLHLAEVAAPEPRPDEILVRVCATEVTKSDCELRSFRFPVKWFWLPLRFALGVRRPRRPILGGYFSGVVEAVGEKVTRFDPGDAVYGSAQLRMGAYGEFLCVPDSYTVTAKPRNMRHFEAAAVPLGGLNALHFMRRAEIQPGETVLINGAGGSIGTFAVQIARAMGASVTVVDAAHKEAMLRRLGAEHFVDYSTHDFAASGRRYDVILNMVATRSFSSCMATLKPGGRYLTANPKLSDMLRASLWPSREGKKAGFAFARETLDELNALTEMIEQGSLTAVVDQCLPLEEAVQAHRRVESEARLGSIVLELAALDTTPQAGRQSD